MFSHIVTYYLKYLLANSHYLKSDLDLKSLDDIEWDIYEKLLPGWTP